MAKTANKPAKKKFKVPHLFAIVMILLVAASIMTYIIPAGVFDTDPETGRVIGESFHYVERTPVNLWQALLKIQPGMVATAQIGMNLLYIGGIIGIFLATNAVDDLIKFSVSKLQDKGVKVLLPSVIFLMSLLGAFAANDTFAAFTVVGLIFAKRLKLDPIIAVMAFFGASYIGFATGPNKIAKTAQLIADVPMFSGFTMRMLIWLILTIVAIIYTMRYAKRILKDPSKSLMGNTDWYDTAVAEGGSATLDESMVTKFNWKFVVSTLIFFGQYIVIAVGTIRNGWGLEYTSAVLSVSTFLIAVVIYRMKLEDMGKAFAKGVSDVAFICVIIGLAKTISLILDAGQVLSTIVYTVSLPLSAMSKGLATIMMYIFNTLFNFLIPSGSGQAAVLMPLMTPVGDLLNIERQVVVSAFALGDGLSNLLWPTVGVTMGALAIADVSYDKWLKFILPLFIIWSVIVCVLLYVLGMIGWTGMGIL